MTMTMRSLTLTVACSLGLVCAGCMRAPGKPGVVTEARPEQVLDFATLYKQNCAACHGENGKGGAAISLANPAYLATAGIDNLRTITAGGVKGSLMPGFGKAAGGMLTGAQVGVLSQGMLDAWGGPSALAGTAPLPYAGQGKGDAAHGQAAYAAFCASCHGPNGTGVQDKIGPIVDPTYLALISDQGLRSIVIAGRPDLGMPDWRDDVKSRPMTDQEVTDIVAWLASQRTTAPGAPYPQRP